MKKQLTSGRIVCYLFCLSMVCAVVFGVSYARYASAVNGKAIATVAAMSQEIKDVKIDISDMAPGESKEVEFQVVNFSGSQISEVGQDYTISVKTSGNLPFKFVLKPAEGTDNPAGELVQENNIWKSKSTGNLPASARTEHSYTLTISWPENELEPNYSDEIDTAVLIIDTGQTMPTAAK